VTACRAYEFQEFIVQQEYLQIKLRDLEESRLDSSADPDIQSALSYPEARIKDLLSEAAHPEFARVSLKMWRAASSPAEENQREISPLVLPAGELLKTVPAGSHEKASKLHIQLVKDAVLLEFIPGEGNVYIHHRGVSQTMILSQMG
jgi:hypothetical protein